MCWTGCRIPRCPVRTRSASSSWPPPTTPRRWTSSASALADNGALPLTFEAVDLKWSETEAGNVVATVNVTTANKPPGEVQLSDGVHARPATAGS